MRFLFKVNSRGSWSTWKNGKDREINCQISTVGNCFKLHFDEF